MFKESQVPWGDRLGRPRTGNVISALIGVVTGAALVLALTTLGDSSDRQPAGTPAAASGDAAQTVAAADVPSIADATAAAASILAPTNERLLRQSLQRPRSVGDPTLAADGALPAWEEAAFEAALADEAYAAVQPDDPALILLARSRARPVRLGETELTEEQLAFAASQEWWAAQVESTGATTDW
jgi:hypothetical protein